jgi:biopolymer transport protein ExbB/TolQ
MTAAWLLQQGAIPTTPMELIRQSTTVTQVVLVILALLSLISWGVIFWTWTQLSSAHNRAQKFAQEFDRTRKLDEANSLARRTTKNGFSKLFLRAAQFISDTRAGTLQGNRCGRYGYSSQCDPHRLPARSPASVARC